MSNSIFSGSKISLSEMLAARELRVKTQRELLSADTEEVLLSATMNIPGPVKYSETFSQVFQRVMEAIEEAVNDVTPLVNLFREEPTGIEYYLLVPLAKEELKHRMVEIEENHDYGRLVDLDVLSMDGEEIQAIGRAELNLLPRKCFVCDANAKICGRSRRHTIEEIQTKIVEIVEKGKVHQND
ncbi:citrate lyase holo-[acyl-carrier protein] synthase [Enterococcus malodoratus]|uniref:citrate lyase holo-[acyl-carrier protein] synthase n=1 Tax=Enterococcus malodoratus ATCC 43197 TaxID=1158601 RepID=R2R7V6_9ENTE|nr:citrate lyase holo-[acyl-carrier protein] synthase [Enterococcus malodoratus]BBM19386.1 citrate lyase holo-ACP synthase [Enterococcus avium]EOH72024.1 holo-ACP synthase CitX [Enterococcus malodoratus ATCC 43197]EOT69952.1 holo-ACP synthase CitX [Enterococcus malodoratus ATCC 43197]SET11508.1 holo-ACP synthase [Enterococcus malodoratus]SPW74925.1 holo-ACP synthase CitX [Enterococcus malodoratus]